MSGKRYDINTVDDFLKVPEDRLPLCLQEFLVFLKIIRRAHAIEVVKIQPTTYKWIDDDEHIAHVKLSVDGKPMIDVKGHIRGFPE